MCILCRMRWLFARGVSGHIPVAAVGPALVAGAAGVASVGDGGAAETGCAALETAGALRLFRILSMRSDFLPETGRPSSRSRCVEEMLSLMSSAQT